MTNAENTLHAMAILEATRAVLNSSTCQFVDTGLPGVAAKYNDIITSIGNLERYIEAQQKRRTLRPEKDKEGN